MANFLKRLYALPFMIGAYTWLALTGFFIYPYFWITGFKGSQLRSFLYFQGKLVQLSIWFGSGFNKKRQGKSKIEKPSILVANHPCSYDTFVFFDFGIKNLVCIAKGWPFRIPFYGRYIKEAGYINSDNKTAQEIIDEVEKRFANNLHVGIFPEGTRKVKTGRFRSLAFEIAIKTKTQVIPFVISGLDIMLPPGTYFPKKAPVKYIQLNPVSSKEFDTEAGALKMAQYVKEMIVKKL